MAAKIGAGGAAAGAGHIGMHDGIVEREAGWLQANEKRKSKGLLGKSLKFTERTYAVR